jgi:IS30 family transposase
MYLDRRIFDSYVHEIWLPFIESKRKMVHFMSLATVKAGSQAGSTGADAQALAQEISLAFPSNAHSYVLDKLKLGWSPEQIAGRLRTEIVQGVRTKDEYINHESIYQYLYDEEQREEKLWVYLPR